MGTGAIFRERCYDDRVQSYVLSDVRSELLRTDVFAVSTNTVDAREFKKLDKML